MRPIRPVYWIWVAQCTCKNRQTECHFDILHKLVEQIERKGHCHITTNWSSYCPVGEILIFSPSPTSRSSQKPLTHWHTVLFTTKVFVYALSFYSNWMSSFRFLLLSECLMNGNVFVQLLYLGKSRKIIE